MSGMRCRSCGSRCTQNESNFWQLRVQDQVEQELAEQERVEVESELEQLTATEVLYLSLIHI